MKLECDSYYFYPDGDYKTTGKWNRQFNCYEANIEQYSKSIRIFGTRKQIDKTLLHREWLQVKHGMLWI